MIRWAIIFFIIALIAIALGFGGVGGIAMNIGWVLLAIAIVLFIVHLVTGRKTV